ncbi:MAG: serine/threonine-protein kinase [Pirellulales bacterium]
MRPIEELDFDELNSVDLICNRFEDLCRSEDAPAIEDFLSEAPAELYSVVLRELLCIEWEIFRQRGLEPQLIDYQLRFPEGEHVIDAAWASYASRRAEVEQTELRGRFRLQKMHAQGGFGQLFVASDEQLRRDVVIKELQVRYRDNPALQSRFQREAEITGALEHPGIAPIYEVGKNPDGYPYIAMRWIRGVSMKESVRLLFAETVQTVESTDRPETLLAAEKSTFPSLEPKTATTKKGLDDSVNFCVPERDPAVQRNDSATIVEHIFEGSRKPRRGNDERFYRSRAFRQIVSRFIFVCEVIEYAHSEGYLHRDLKPSNIMLGEHGETVVVDWGLASRIHDGGSSAERAERAAQNASSDRDITLPGDVLGTPAYMSPAQSSGAPGSVLDDVYSLGATLFFLVTGENPPESRCRVDVRDPFQATLSRTSLKIPKALAFICNRAAAVDPLARHPSARALADDLESWLTGDVPQGFPEPLGDRCRRQLTKHFQWAIASAAAAAVIVAVCAVALGFILKKNHDLTVSEDLAEGRRRAVEQINQELTTNIAQLEQDTDLIADIFEGLDPVNTFERPDEVINMLGSRLREVSDHIDADSRSRDSAIRLKLVLGSSLDSLGFTREACRILAEAEAACDAKSPMWFKAKLELGKARSSANDYAAALKLFEECAGRLDERGESTDDFSLTCILETSAAALNCGEVVKAQARLSQFDRLKDRHLVDRAVHSRAEKIRAAILSRFGLYTEAVTVLESLAKTFEDSGGASSLDYANVLNELSVALYSAGRSEQAIQTLRDCLSRIEPRLSADHPAILCVQSSIATLLQFERHFEEAESLHRRCIQAEEAAGRGGTYDMLKYKQQLAQDLFLQGKELEAISVFRDTLEKMQSRYGENHLLTVEAMHNLAVRLLMNGNADEAQPLLEKCYRARVLQLGENHPDTLETLNGLAGLIRKRGDPERAMRLFAKIYEKQVAALGHTHSAPLQVLNNLGAAQLLDGRLDDAKKSLRSVYEHTLEGVGREHPSTLRQQARLAYVLLLCGEVKEADQHFETSLQLQKKLLGPTHPDVLESMTNMAFAKRDRRDWKGAADLFSELVSLCHSESLRGDPLLTPCSIHRSEALMHLDRLEEARESLEEEFESARTGAGQDKDTRRTIARLMGTIEYRLNRFQAASDAFEVSLLTESNEQLQSADDWLSSAACAMRQSRYEEAKKWIELCLNRPSGKDHDEASITPDGFEYIADIESMINTESTPTDLRDAWTSLKARIKSADTAGRHVSDVQHADQ